MKHFDADDVQDICLAQVSYIFMHQKQSPKPQKFHKLYNYTLIHHTDLASNKHMFLISDQGGKELLLYILHINIIILITSKF